MTAMNNDTVCKVKCKFTSVQNVGVSLAVIMSVHNRMITLKKMDSCFGNSKMLPKFHPGPFCLSVGIV